MIHISEIKSGLRPIKSRSDHNKYLKIIDTLIDCRENSKEEELLELIAILVADYESRKFKIEKPDPIQAIKIRMNEMGLRNKDMEEYFGSRSRVSEVLSGKRSMSLSMIKKLHDGLKIAPEILLA